MKIIVEVDDKFESISSALSCVLKVIELGQEYKIYKVSVFDYEEENLVVDVVPDAVFFNTFYVILKESNCSALV